MSEYSDSGSGGEGPTVEPSPFEETLRFLRAMRHDGRCVVSAICPVVKGRIETRTFDLEPPDALCSWLERWNGERNLYWTPNTVKATADPNDKPSEADIEQLDMLHVDIDPRDGVDPADEQAWQAERSRILKQLEGFAPTPSAIVDSGNGYQAFWQLVPDDRLFLDGHPDAVAEAKLYNIELRNRLGGDRCQSLDHLMRLPGTQNIPNSDKRKAGRIERTASVVRWPEA
ncbi:hypothetical protein [Croceicoccus gelatinilyticus]|uniref:hypothetical protein n=1 Tax=Croceicoccus gelatinilyticus TaxID=2835536 RepID=UPI001BCE02B3|nr:hypothetical protein [Croceicoccus gelatinilyticus]MBS7669447.1 hypothetical protein [Croceicoccus gelatinilyticus]